MLKALIGNYKQFSIGYPRDVSVWTRFKVLMTYDKGDCHLVSVEWKKGWNGALACHRDL